MLDGIVKYCLVGWDDKSTDENGYRKDRVVLERWGLDRRVEWRWD